MVLFFESIASDLTSLVCVAVLGPRPRADRTSRLDPDRSSAHARQRCLCNARLTSRSCRRTSGSRRRRSPSASASVLPRSRRFAAATASTAGHTARYVTCRSRCALRGGRRILRMGAPTPCGGRHRVQQGRGHTVLRDTLAASVFASVTAPDHVHIDMAAAGNVFVRTTKGARSWIEFWRAPCGRTPSTTHCGGT